MVNGGNSENKIQFRTKVSAVIEEAHVCCFKLFDDSFEFKNMVLQPISLAFDAKTLKLSVSS